MNEKIKKQIELIMEEQMRAKQFLNDNNFDCTTAPSFIVKRYRDELKKYLGVLRTNLEE